MNLFPNLTKLAVTLLVIPFSVIGGSPVSMSNPSLDTGKIRKDV